MLTATHIYEYRDFASILCIVSFVATIGLAITSTSLPRRPDVYFNGCQVDRQFTVHTLNRYTWSWIQPLLLHASIHKDIGTEDIPEASSRLRSEHLKNEWDRSIPRSSLFRSLVHLYKGRLALLWMATLVRCAVSTLPFWSMYRILIILQDRTNGPKHMNLVALITCMAVSNLIDSVSLVH